MPDLLLSAESASDPEGLVLGSGDEARILAAPHLSRDLRVTPGLEDAFVRGMTLAQARGENAAGAVELRHTHAGGHLESRVVGCDAGAFGRAFKTALENQEEEQPQAGEHDPLADMATPELGVSITQLASDVHRIALGEMPAEDRRALDRAVLLNVAAIMAGDDGGYVQSDIYIARSIARGLFGDDDSVVAPLGKFWSARSAYDTFHRIRTAAVGSDGFVGSLARMQASGRMGKLLEVLVPEFPCLPGPQECSTGASIGLDRDMFLVAVGNNALDLHASKTRPYSYVMGVYRRFLAERERGRLAKCPGAASANGGGAEAEFFVAASIAELCQVARWVPVDPDRDADEMFLTFNNKFGAVMQGVEQQAAGAVAKERSFFESLHRQVASLHEHVASLAGHGRDATTAARAEDTLRRIDDATALLFNDKDGGACATSTAAGATPRSRAGPGVGRQKELLLGRGGGGTAATRSDEGAGGVLDPSSHAF